MIIDSQSTLEALCKFFSRSCRGVGQAPYNLAYVAGRFDVMNHQWQFAFAMPLDLASNRRDVFWVDVIDEREFSPSRDFNHISRTSFGDKPDSSWFLVTAIHSDVNLSPDLAIKTLKLLADAMRHIQASPRYRDLGDVFWLSVAKNSDLTDIWLNFEQRFECCARSKIFPSYDPALQELGRLENLEVTRFSSPVLVKRKAADHFIRVEGSWNAGQAPIVSRMYLPHIDEIQGTYPYRWLNTLPIFPSMNSPSFPNEALIEQGKIFRKNQGEHKPLNIGIAKMMQRLKEVRKVDDYQIQMAGFSQFYGFADYAVKNGWIEPSKDVFFKNDMGDFYKDAYGQF